MAKKDKAPSLSTNPSDEHRFYELGAKRFEHFARAVHEAQPDIVSTAPYGPDGQTQYGADHIAFHRTANGAKLEVGQSKAERRFGQPGVRAAAKAFLDHWDSHWKPKEVSRFILFVGCAIKSREAHEEIITQTKAFAKFGVEFLVWDANAIYERLPGAPRAVRAYLTQEWYERLFGKPASPLSELQRDLETGWSLGAVRVQGYVTRLNQAETAENQELRRRARRGEGPRVIEELDLALRSAAAEATAPAVRAEKLRILAGLLMPGGDYARIGRLLDDADALDGESARLRAVLLLESVGAEEVLQAVPTGAEADLAEVRAVAQLRLGQAKDAAAELAPFLTGEEVKAETLRLAAIAALLDGDRACAVAYVEQAIAREPESRACRQMLGIAVFHRALSPAVAPATGEWPEPIDQPLVGDGDSDRADLASAEAQFRTLMADERLDGHQSMVMWHFAVLACTPARREEAEARLRQLQADNKLPIPLIVWALTRALPFDRSAAAAQCDARLAESPDDFETLLIRVALAHASRDFAGARTLLESRRAALSAAGHQSLLDYWFALLAVDGRGAPSDEIIAAHPFLKLRQALAIRAKTKRLKAVSALLEEALAEQGDPRLILAATQILLEGRWHRVAAKAAPFLVEKVGTAEAITTAAHAFFQNEQASELLAALTNTDAFPGGKLPVDLERLRTAGLAITGALVEARDLSLEVAHATRHPVDLWRTIQLQLAVGAAADALALYEEHSSLLAEPRPEHVQLARAVLQSHPDAAERITRRISAEAPDELVTAAFELASKLRMSAEQRILIGRIQALGAAGKAGVSMVSLDDIGGFIKEQRKQAEQAFETYANGHAPIHGLVRSGSSALTSTLLAPLLEPPGPQEARPLLSARYGRRLEDDPWPAERCEVRLLADLTALLTAHGLDLLDAVERAFGPIWIAPDAVQLLIAMRSETEVAQPERLDAMRAVLARLDAGELADQSALDQVDSFTVLWGGDGGEPEATLSFPRLAEILLARLGAKAAKAARDALGNTLDAPATGASPRKDAILNLEAGIATLLEEAGLLAKLASDYRVALERREIDDCRANLAEAERRQKLGERLSALIARLRTGLEDGTYKAVAQSGAEVPEPVRRSYLQLLEAAAKTGGILWVDDRFTSSITNPDLKVATSIEIIDALVRFERLSLDQAYGLRQRLRRARWQFMPLRGGEIVHYLRPAVKRATLTESEDLAVLRRSVADALGLRRRLQWPTPEALEQGNKGEVPFLLDCGHAVSAALAEIWGSNRWSIADAEAASEWLLDNLEMNLFPMRGIAAGDPRSDLLIGVHLGALVLVAAQILTARSQEKRQTAYLDFLWRHLIGNMIRTRPEIREPMEQMIESHFTRGEESLIDERLWFELSARTLNAMPYELRLPLLKRPTLRKAFALPDHGQLTVIGLDFDEVEFWRAVLAAGKGKPQRLEAETGEAATVRLVQSDQETHLSLAVGSRRFRLDDWPRRIASDDCETRRQALEERSALLDLAPAALGRLNDELAAIADKVERIRHAMRATNETARHFYAEFDARVRKRAPFAIWDLRPGDLAAVVRDLRLNDDDVDRAAATLIAERGLAVALRRLGGLPIVSPASLAHAVEALDDAGLDRLIVEAQIDTAPPWTQLLLAELILRRSPSPQVVEQIKGWVDNALSPGNELVWRLYQGLALFTCHEARAVEGWRDLSGRQQLAACWHHAGLLSESLGAGIKIEPLLKALESNRLASPRGLIERVDNFEGDIADPRLVTVERLRVHAAASALFALRELPDVGPWAEQHLKALLIETGKGKPGRPRMEIIRATLASGDLLASHLGRPWGAAFAELEPGAKGLFRDGAADLLMALLGNEAGSMEVKAGWYLLRDASGDVPLPADLAKLAQERAALLNLTDETKGVADARMVLLTFAALAAVNSWRDESERIAAAAHALGPRAEDKDGMVLLEIATWRARLVDDPIERTKLMAEELLRIGEHPQLHEQAEFAARQFGRGLSGEQSEAFVDAYASLSRTR